MMIKLIPKSKLSLKLLKFKEGGSIKGPDFSNIITTNNRSYSVDAINYINNKLSKFVPNLKQRAVILASIIEESGGNPLALSENDLFYGLLQWDEDRYVSKSENKQEEMDNLILLIIDTINNTLDRKSWTHGGEGSGYNSRLDAHNTFSNVNLPIDNINHAFTRGYVRPSGKNNSVNNRLKVAKQVYNRLIQYYGK